MNGEMYQICRIAVAAKKALMDQTEIHYTYIDYENKIEFRFLSNTKMSGQSDLTAKNVAEWFQFCKERKLQEIKLMAPFAVENRSWLGFSNTTRSSLLCFYEQGIVTYFSPTWNFIPEQKKWNIIYTEYEFQNPPEGRPHFEDNTDAFKYVLTEIADFADVIDFAAFANIFRKAKDILDGASADNALEFSQLPDKNRHILQAASVADVFGAMGSWNDSPPYYAHEKGLENEYNRLSDELLKQIRLAILYAINEW